MVESDRVCGGRRTVHEAVVYGVPAVSQESEDGVLEGVVVVVVVYVM